MLFIITGPTIRTAVSVSGSAKKVSRIALPEGARIIMQELPSGDIKGSGDLACR